MNTSGPLASMTLMIRRAALFDLFSFRSHFDTLSTDIPVVIASTACDMF